MGTYDNIIVPVTGQPVSVGLFGVPVRDAIRDLDVRVGALEATPWAAYAPSFTATTGTPAMGTGGSLNGRYKQLGKTVILNIDGTFGTASPVFGTGTWAFSLPVAASAVNNMRRVGSCYCRDASAAASGHFNGVCTIQPSLSLNTVFMFVNVSQVGAVAPFTWAINDFFSMTITYESA
jgi:hypothetical protein